MRRRHPVLAHIGWSGKRDVWKKTYKRDLFAWVGREKFAGKGKKTRYFKCLFPIMYMTRDLYCRPIRLSRKKDIFRKEKLDTRRKCLFRLETSRRHLLACKEWSGKRKMKRDLWKGPTHLHAHCQVRKALLLSKETDDYEKRRTSKIYSLAWMGRLKWENLSVAVTNSLISNDPFSDKFYHFKRPILPLNSLIWQCTAKWENLSLNGSFEEFSMGRLKWENLWQILSFQTTHENSLIWQCTAKWENSHCEWVGLFYRSLSIYISLFWSILRECGVCLSYVRILSFRMTHSYVIYLIHVQHSLVFMCHITPSYAWYHMRHICVMLLLIYVSRY